VAVTRPGLTPSTLTGFTGNIAYADSKPYGATPYTVLLSSNGKVYKLVGTACTELTGVTTSFGSAAYHNVEVVNGVLLIANDTGGLIRWNPSGTTLTQLTTAKYRYVTSHLSRAVAAYDTNASALLGPRTVGWSIAGDETDWAGAGSGSTCLSDAVDDITGLGVCHNVLVILRRKGKHLGYATGVSSPAFRFENHTRSGIGCYYPGTASFDANTAFYVGIDDVYAFDLTTEAPIGQNIRRELLASLRAGCSYRGFISRVSEAEPRARYHLVCTSGQPPVPHYSYDIQSEAWSRHTYKDYQIQGGWQLISSASSEVVALHSGATPLQWSATASLDTPAYVRSGVITVGSLGAEMALTRSLIRYCERTAGQLLLTVENGRESKVTLVPLMNEDTYKWRRVWADLRLTGQDFVVSLETKDHLAMDYLGLDVSPAGVYRNG